MSKLFFILTGVIFTGVALSGSGFAEPKASTRLFDEDFEKKETEIKAKKLLLDGLSREFTYTGDVTVVQGDLTLTSERLDGNYTEKNEIQSLTALENVVITKGPSIKARGSKAVFSAAKQTLVLTGSPEIEQNKSILSADKITLFLEENRSVAEGQVHVKVIEEGSAKSTKRNQG